MQYLQCNTNTVIANIENINYSNELMICFQEKIFKGNIIGPFNIVQ